MGYCWKDFFVCFNGPTAVSVLQPEEPRPNSVKAIYMASQKKASSNLL